MLSMDDIKYIKRLHGCEGASIREIMRRTGYHYETVKKYLNMEDFNEPLHPPREVPSLLDPLKPIIDFWLEEDLAAPRKQRHTAKRVYKRLLQEYPEKLAVKQRTVQYYVSQKKKELFNCAGVLVFSTTKDEIEVSHLAKGFYYIMCDGASKKVIVE